MPCGGTSLTPEEYRALKKKRDAYQAKLVAKGIHPKSMKMLELMYRKFR